MEKTRSIHEVAYFNLLKTGSWIEEQIKNALRPYGLTHAQLNALYILFEKDPEPVSASDLKKRILVSNPDITRLMDRLVIKGFVERMMCPENRRKIDISLTESGRKLFREAHQSVKQALGNFFEKQLTEVEAKELRDMMQKMRM
jgi:DNA-binding MarR family transcriptional regulator